MALCTPLVRGPLTEWTDSVLVEGCLPGAAITVTALGSSIRTVAKGVANGGSDRVPLLAGEKLFASDRLVVFQTLAGESSIETPGHLAMPVSPAPINHDSLAPLAFRSHVFPCGRGLWLCGAVPGAQVTVRTSSQIIAGGRANENGDARLTLNPGASISFNDQLMAWQNVPVGAPPLPGTIKNTNYDVTQLPAPWGEKLPVPLLTAPAKGCDRSVHLGGIRDGADVTIRRASDGTTETALFDLDRLRFDLLEALDPKGDKLEVVQELTGCGRWEASDPLVVHVDPAKKPGTPVLTPPCNDAVDIHASGLEPGAVAKLTFAGETYHAMIPEGATSFVFRLAKMNAGATITLLQEKCRLSSDLASTQAHATGGGTYYPPDVEEPLYPCARAVRVRARPGTWVQVWGDAGAGPGPISNQVFCAGSTRIDVAPHLVKDQKVWLIALKCGDTAWTPNSNVHTVQPLPEQLSRPSIAEPLVEGAKSVLVEGVAGAFVQVWSFGGSPPIVERIGEGVIDPVGRRVFLSRQLTRKELAYVVQFLCGVASPPSAGQVPIPNLCAFYLGAPIKRMSHQSSSMLPLRCLSASFTCRHDGSWAYTAELENEETEADVSFELQFTLVGVTPPFGAPLRGDLSAAGTGPVTKTGMRIQGIPPKKQFIAPGHFAGFEDPTYWAQVCAASEKFEFAAVAWKNYAPSPEAPDTEDPPDEPKPGSNK